MGERAFEEEANEDDLSRMVGQLRESIQAGAMGFTTSISVNHATSDDRPVASRIAQWDEIDALVTEMGRLGAGIFELANHHHLRSRDPGFHLMHYPCGMNWGHALWMNSGLPLPTRPLGDDLFKRQKMVITAGR